MNYMTSYFQLLDFGKQTSSAEKHSGKTDIRLDVTYTEYLIPAYHRQGRPHLQLRFDFSPFASEVDISIIDRLGALLWTQLLPRNNVESAVSFKHQRTLMASGKGVFTGVS